MAVDAASAGDVCSPSGSETPSPRPAATRDRSGMTIPLAAPLGDGGRQRRHGCSGGHRQHTSSSASQLRQPGGGHDWAEPAGPADCRGHRSPRLSPSSARDLRGHSASTSSMSAVPRDISTSAGQLGRSPGASPHSSCSCSHSAELHTAAAGQRRRPRPDASGEPPRRHRPRTGPGGRPPRRRIQLERQALSLDGKPRSSQAQRRRQATLLRQTTVEVPDCAYLPRLDLESAALGRPGPRSSGALSQRSSGALSQRSSGVLRQSTQDTSEARVSSASLAGRSPHGAGSAVSGSASLVDLTAAGSELAAPMLPVLALAVQRRAAARGQKKRGSPGRMRWVVIVTGLTLLLISVCLIGVTLRMAPMIDDMGESGLREGSAHGSTAGTSSPEPGAVTAETTAGQHSIALLVISGMAEMTHRLEIELYELVYDS